MKNLEENTQTKYCKTCGSKQNEKAIKKCDNTLHNTMMTWGGYEFCPHCGINLHPKKEIIKVYGAKFCRTCGTDENHHKSAVNCLVHHPAAVTIPCINFCEYCGKNLKPNGVNYGRNIPALC